MSEPINPSAARRRSAFVALAAGLVLPAALLFAFAAAAYPESALKPGNAILWGSVITGSFLAAALVMLRKRTPAWGAVSIGVLTVLVLMFGAVAWSEHQAGLELESLE